MVSGLLEESVEEPDSLSDSGGDSASPYLWMLSGCFFFSIMGTLTHSLRHTCDWRIIALVRSSVAFLLAALLARRAGIPLVWFGPRTLWVRSIAGSISLISTFYALTRLPISDVLTITNTFPIWVAFLSWPLLNEVPGPDVWISALVGFCGVAIVQQPHLVEGNFATLVALGSSVCTAVAMIGLHRVANLDPRCIVVHFSGVGSLFCIGAFFAFGTDASTLVLPSGPDVLLLLGVGISATIGQLFLTKAFAAGSPAKVSVIGLSQVVMAMGFDWLLFGRSFQPITLIGILLVLAPTAWLLIHRTNENHGDA